MAYGDIAGPDDADYYSLPVAAGNSGPFTLEVTSAGISLLMPRLSLLDEGGTVIAESESHEPLGASCRWRSPR